MEVRRGSGLGESSHGVLSRNLPVGTKENHSVWPTVRLRFVPSNSRIQVYIVKCCAFTLLHKRVTDIATRVEVIHRGELKHSKLWPSYSKLIVGFTYNNG